MFPPDLEVFPSSSETNWIVKLKIRGAKGLQSKDAYHPEQPSSFFCGISLLLEGTNIDDCACEHDVYPFDERDNEVWNAPFRVELQRSTEQRTALIPRVEDSSNASSSQSSTETSDEEEFQLYGPGMPHLIPTPIKGKREHGLSVEWDEEFCFGVSHPDICPDEDNGEGLSDHRELRPRLAGEPLQLLITLHAIDSAGRFENLGQVRDPALRIPSGGSRPAAGLQVAV